MLPEAARRWGRWVGTSFLRPGDILLTRQFKQVGKPLGLVEQAQRLHGACEECIHLTHAALILGHDDLICEALPYVGVVERSIHEYADGQHALMVRRPRGLSDAERLNMALLAQSHLGRRYDWYGAIRHAARSAGRLFSGAALEQQRNVISAVRAGSFVCSSLCQDVLLEARRVTNPPIPEFVMPFHFITCRLMESQPVPIHWAS